MDKGIVLPSKKAGKKPTDLTTMQVTWRLKDYLAKNGQRGESDEEVVWRILGQKTLTKEESKGVRSKFEESL